MFREYKKRLKNKNLVVIFVFLILLGAAFVLRNPHILPTSKKTEAVFPRFNKEKIKKIEIERAGIYKNVLVKKDPSTGSGQAWVVESKDNFPANTDKVESLLDATAGLEKKELVSKNKENHENYKVGSLGIKVVLEGGAKEYKFVVGKRGPGFSSTYFRKSSEDEVYLSGQDLELVFGVAEWRDLKLKLQSEKGKIKNINIQNKNGLFELEKKGERWELVKPESKEKVVQSRVEDLVSQLTTLEAEDATMSAELSKTGFNNPVIIVQVQGEGGEDKLVIGAENKNSQRYAQISTSPYIYLLSPSDYGTFGDIGRDFFFDKEES